MSNSTVVAEIMRRYDGKTVMLFLESIEGITMDQIIPEAKIEVDEDETLLSFKSKIISEIAQFPLHFEMDFEINELDEEDVKSGALQSLSIIYPSGNEMQIEIVEND